MKKLNPYPLRKRPALFSLSTPWLVALGFFLPFFICAVVYCVAGYYPFGNRQILVTDSWHQYFPMVRDLIVNLKEGGSLLYNWSTGLGSNYLNIIGYYCASPLYLLGVLIPEEHLRVFFTLCVGVRIGTAGATGAYFLSKVFRRKDISVVFFSTLWALCACIMGYYWNVMWLDSIALLPLVMLGMIRLIRERRGVLYTVSLALCLFCNYYIGFYICIGVLAASIGTVVVNWRGIREALFAALRMLTHSLAGIAMSAVLLLPTFMALQNTYSASNNNVGTLLWNGSFMQFLSALFPYQLPNTKDLDTPNLCCGLICVLLFVLFLTGRFSLGKKLCTCAGLGLLMFSFLFRPLDFTWNGFHYTNMIPFRYSFLFSFLLVAAAYYMWCNLHRINRDWVIYAFVVTAAAACLCYAYISTTVILLTVGTALIYCAVLYIYAGGRLNHRTTALILCLFMAVEAAVAGAMGIHEYSDYDTYLQRDAEVDSLTSMAEKTDSFYRIEHTNTKTLNDSLLYGYNGISQFSSGANAGVSRYLAALGCGGYPAGNRYVFYHTTPAVQSTLALKYLIAQYGHSSGDRYLSMYANHNTTTMFEYTRALPLAFTVEGGADLEFESNEDPFKNQNELWRAMTGVEEDLFETYSAMEVSAKGGTVSGSAGSYTYTPDEETEDEDPVELTYTVTAQEEGMYYLFPKVQEANNLVISLGGTDVSFNYSYGQACILPAGYLQAGQEVKLRITPAPDTADRSYVADLQYAVMDAKVFERGYTRLKSEAAENDSYTDTSYRCTVNAAEPATLYTSIPYERGWSAYVDGEKVDTAAYAGAFVSLEIDAGEHEIELKYTPEGFVPGVVLTLLGIVFLVLSTLYFRRKRKAELTALRLRVPPLFEGSHTQEPTA